MKLVIVAILAVAIAASCAMAGYNPAAAKTAAQRVCQQTSGGSIDKWCTDFVNQVLVAGGLTSTGTRSAAQMAQVLVSRGWSSSSWTGSCADGTVLFYPQGVCADFAGNNHVAMCFGNKRFQWNPSRCSTSPAWGNCKPRVLKWGGGRMLNATA